MRCESGSTPTYFFFLCEEILFDFSSSGRSWVKSLAKLLHLGHIDIAREIQLQQERVFPMPLRIG